MRKRPKTPKEFKFRRYHFLAIELRYQGKTYKEITENLTTVFKVSFRPDRIGHWFATDGILEKAYIDYARKENERIRRFIHEELKKLLPRIPKKLEELLQRRDEFGQPKLDAVTLGAIRTLCDLLDLKESIQEGPEGTQNRVDEYFERLEEHRADLG